MVAKLSNWMTSNLAELCTGWLITVFLKNFKPAENYTGT